MYDTYTHLYGMGLWLELWCQSSEHEAFGSCLRHGPLHFPSWTLVSFLLLSCRLFIFLSLHSLPPWGSIVPELPHPHATPHAPGEVTFFLHVLIYVAKAGSHASKMSPRSRKLLEKGSQRQPWEVSKHVFVSFSAHKCRPLRNITIYYVS